MHDMGDTAAAVVGGVLRCSSLCTSAGVDVSVGVSASGGSGSGGRGGTGPAGRGAVASGGELAERSLGGLAASLFQDLAHLSCRVHRGGGGEGGGGREGCIYVLTNVAQLQQNF